MHPNEEEEKNEDNIVDSSDLSEEDINDFSDFDEEITFPFMPGNNDKFVGNRRYLAWNYYAAALLRRKQDDSTEIDIHTMEDGKIRTISNLYNFNLFAIDEFGYVGASTSTLIYTHHKSWAPDNVTTLSFDNESIKLVACGEEWFAVATDSHYIRTFTSAGLELDIIQIPYSCTVMIGRGKYLFYACGKDLEFSMISVLKNKIVVQGSIPIMQPMKWIGFDENNEVYVQDRMNVSYPGTIL